VVDEAFMDNTPQLSLAAMPIGLADRVALVRQVLRPGRRAAGLRAGEPALLQALAELLGPWTVSGPTGCWARCAWPMNWPT
jgi:cobalamin biosynthetic protein CobC